MPDKTIEQMNGEFSRVSEDKRRKKNKIDKGEYDSEIPAESQFMEQCNTNNQFNKLNK